MTPALPPMGAAGVSRSWGMTVSHVSEKRYRVAAALSVFAMTGLASCRRVPDVDSHFVSTWAYSLYGAIRNERLSPPVASRLMAYASTALYSGYAAVDPSAPSLAGKLNGLPELPRRDPGTAYDAATTAVAAERTVLDSLFREGLPVTRASLTRLADSLARARAKLGVGESVRTASEDLGRRIGNAIVAWSRTDGFDGTRGRKYAARTGDALWVNDAPASTYTAQNLSAATDFIALNNPSNALQSGNASDRGLIVNRPKSASNRSLPAVNMAGLTEPYWGEVRPFVLSNATECPVPEPPPYSTDTSSRLYQDAREVYSIMLKNKPERLAMAGDIESPTERERTVDERRAIALAWADNAGETGTPVGHWSSIAGQMVNARNVHAADAARIWALTSIAQADAFIAAWDYKFKYSLIRPRTYIRRVIDPNWEPAIPTPPFPEYPSAHSTQSAAAASVLSAFFGDSVVFVDSTGLSIGTPIRRFTSFTAAAHEAGLSRIYGGIHFQYGNLGGRSLGECIGARVVERLNAARLH